jgi:hypothetical protein
MGSAGEDKEGLSRAGHAPGDLGLTKGTSAHCGRYAGDGVGVRGEEAGTESLVKVGSGKEGRSGHLGFLDVPVNRESKEGKIAEKRRGTHAGDVGGGAGQGAGAECSLIVSSAGKGRKGHIPANERFGKGKTVRKRRARVTDVEGGAGGRGKEPGSLKEEEQRLAAGRKNRLESNHNGYAEGDEEDEESAREGAGDWGKEPGSVGGEEWKRAGLAADSMDGLEEAEGCPTGNGSGKLSEGGSEQEEGHTGRTTEGMEAGPEMGGAFTALDAAVDPFAFDSLSERSPEGIAVGTGGPRNRVAKEASLKKGGRGSSATASGRKEKRTPTGRTKVESPSKAVVSTARLEIPGHSNLVGREVDEAARLGTTGQKEGAPPAEPSFLDTPEEAPAPVAYKRRKRGALTSPVEGKSENESGAENGKAGESGDGLSDRPMRASKNRPGRDVRRKGGSRGSNRKRKGGRVGITEREGGKGGVEDRKSGRANTKKGWAENGEKEGRSASKELSEDRLEGLQSGGETHRDAGEGALQERLRGAQGGLGTQSETRGRALQESAGGVREKDGEAVGKRDQVIAETPLEDGFSDWGLGPEEYEVEQKSLVAGMPDPKACTQEPEDNVRVVSTGPGSPDGRKTPARKTAQTESTNEAQLVREPSVKVETNSKGVGVQKGRKVKGSIQRKDAGEARLGEKALGSMLEGDVSVGGARKREPFVELSTTGTSKRLKGRT